MTFSARASERLAETPGPVAVRRWVCSGEPLTATAVAASADDQGKASQEIARAIASAGTRSCC